MVSFSKLCSDTLPAGTYKAQVTDVKLSASATGEAGRNFAVKYTIVEGPYAKRTLNDTIFEKAYTFRLMPFLQACGVDVNREFASVEELLQYGANQAKGKILNIEVEIRPYNGKEYNNVRTWIPLPESKVSEADVLAEFDEVPAAKAAKPAEEVAEAAIAEATEEPSIDVVDDDIPF